MEKFRELGLDGNILRGIADLGFETPSVIQEKVIPLILKQDNDLVALAQTGTGKTAAFGLPILQTMDMSDSRIQVIILSPTRELCVQIGKDLNNYSKYRSDIKVVCVYGGADIRRQIKEIERGVHIIVATPGRLCDLIKRGVVNRDGIRTVVLDEADEMLNMGFKEDLNFILEETPKTRHTYLFSATMPKEVERISRSYLSNPIEISAGKKNQGADTVTHQYYQVLAKNFYETLHRIVDCAPDMYAIIFTRTRMDARDISRKLQKDGIDCDALHGDLSQSQRDDVMMRFRSKRLKVLVATDVAARGLDVDNLTHVINYNLPEDIESYTHRSGRTGRAGKQGISVAIINSREKGKIKRIEGIINKKFQYMDVPGGDEVCRAQLKYYSDKIIDAQVRDYFQSYRDEIMNRFADLTKEEIIEKVVSYEFGKILKKYTGVSDLNMTPDERKTEREKGKGGRRENTKFTEFKVNIGKEDGLNPKALMEIINRSSPVKGVEIGAIRIFDTDTRFEVEIDNASKFIAAFYNENFNGLPFILHKLENSNRGGDKRSGDRRDRRPRSFSGGSRRRDDNRGRRDSRKDGRKSSGNRRKR